MIQDPAMSDPVSLVLDRVLDRFRHRILQAGAGHGVQEEAVDLLLQEVRIRLWRAGERGETVESLPASYVYRVAASAAVDLLRRGRSRREDRMEGLEGRQLPIPAGDPAGNPSAAVEAEELGRAVRDSLEALSASRRPVVRMYLEGYSRSEVAALLGWSEGKVRNLLYRGLEDLREELTRRGVAPPGRDR